MKRLSLLTTVSGLLLLSGCAGTESRFQCNETTHDSCMTMAQANEKAKLHEETPLIKRDAHRLPKLTEEGGRAQLPEPRKNLAFSQKTRRLTPSSTEKTKTIDGYQKKHDIDDAIKKIVHENHLKKQFQQREQNRVYDLNKEKTLDE